MREMRATREEISKFIEDRERPKWYNAFTEYFQSIGYATKLIFLEKQLFVLALTQWAVIAIGYYFWIQILNWIPDHVWEMALNSEVPLIIDLLFFAWSFMIVGIVALPIGILSACMGAVHFLHQQNEDVSLSRCFKIVIPRGWSLWVFSWIDCWWTVSQILERLPKRGGSWSFHSEIIYLAWKLGTMGMLPAMITGKNLVSAGRDSIEFISSKFTKASIIRLGYSTACWIVGIITYIGGFALLMYKRDSIINNSIHTFPMFEFYYWIGIPVVLSAAIILFVLRPVYIIMVCDLYSTYTSKQGRPPILKVSHNRSLSVLVTFSVLVLIILAVYLFREELGILSILNP